MQIISPPYSGIFLSIFSLVHFLEGVLQIRKYQFGFHAKRNAIQKWNKTYDFVFDISN